MNQSPWQSNQQPYGQPQWGQQPPPRKPGFWEWYYARTRTVRIILVCGTLLALLLFYSGLLAAFGAGNLKTPAASPTQPTATFAQVAEFVSPVVTMSPTPVPTQQSTPTPTLIPTQRPTPTPTFISIVAPTQVSRPTPTPWPTPTPRPTQSPPSTPTPRPMPTPQPTQPPPPTPTPRPTCQAINNNPWCYNFSPGNLITNPPANFCSYFNCIASFQEPDDPDGGYVVECSDGTYSQSGGERGACSFHGGVLRPLYSH